MTAPASMRRRARGRWWGWRGAVAVGAALSVALLLVARAGRAAQRRAEGAHLDLAAVRHAVCAQVLPLGHTDADRDSAALQTVIRLAEGAAVLGLGESTHGTAEFFALKSRVIRALIERAGVRTIAFEASWERAAEVDAFLATGDGDARAAVARLGFWTWNTEEVIALVEWMRAFNAQRPTADRIRFTGFDPQLTQSWTRARRLPGFLQSYLRDRRMAEHLLETATDRPERAPVVAWAHNGHLARAWPYMGRALGRRLGDRYRVIGLLADTGRFSAMVPDARGQLALGVARLHPPAERTLEGLLSSCGHANSLLAISPARRASPVLADAFGSQLRMRSVGAVVTSDSMPQFHGTRAAAAFDMLWHTRASTPTQVIPLPGMRRQ